MTPYTKWAVAFVVVTSFTMGMLLATQYFPDASPDKNLGRMMASLALASIVSGAMTVLEAGRV